MSIVGRLKISARIMCGEEPAIGPGKALVMEAIARAGSISAAGRELGMSYRRTWLLVDALNRCWDAPLIETTSGGRSGSRLSPLGEEVLRHYRAVEAQMERAAESADYRILLDHLRAAPLAARPAPAESASKR